MILVCGEALIDLFVAAEDPTGRTLTGVVGGSPFNLAAGLARLGVRTAFFGGVSTDHFGRLIADGLAAEGIDRSLLRRSSLPSPLVVVTPDEAGHPSYAFYARSAECDVRVADVPAQLQEGTTALALGSYLLAHDPIGPALLALAQREAGRRVISLDCNLRPALAGPLEVWREQIDHFARIASIIKLSDEDFISGWGRDARIQELVDRWMGYGAHVVVMTLGAGGAVAWSRSGRTTLRGPAIRVVDTVGAGDSFQAAFLARLTQRGLLSPKALEQLDQHQLADAVHYANVAAGLTCSRRGADLPRRAAVDAAVTAAFPLVSEPALIWQQ